MESVGTRDIDPSTVVGTREHADVLAAKRFPAVRDAMQWLTFSHLPVPLQNYSRPFYVAAMELLNSINDSPELTHALNGLISAKDWAVRAGIRTDTGRAGSVPRPADVVNPPNLSDPALCGPWRGLHACPQYDWVTVNHNEGSPAYRPLREESPR